MIWADEIVGMSPTDRTRKSYGPFFVEPSTGKLSMIYDSLRKTPNLSKEFPISPSKGWVQKDKYIVWCPLGGEDFFLFNKPFKKIHGPSSGMINLSYNDAFWLIGNGHAFVYCDSMYFLPEQKFDMNSFTYNIDGFENLQVFIGYRGHTANYDEIITPSLYRKANDLSQEKFDVFRKKETYSTNIIKQMYWEKYGIALYDIQARGILQHHKIIGDTGILDLSYDINVAKWFSLNKWDCSKGKFEKKEFKKSEFEEAYDEASLVYEVIVRVIGGSEDPLPIKLKGNDIRLQSWNISPLWSERPFAQSGFGIDGIFSNDFDSLGAVLNIVEHKFHPKAFPNGWEKIGGNTITLFGDSYNVGDDMSHLESKILPAEDEWFLNLKETIFDNIDRLR